MGSQPEQNEVGTAVDGQPSMCWTRWVDEEWDVSGLSLGIRAFVGQEIGFVKGVLLI